MQGATETVSVNVPFKIVPGSSNQEEILSCENVAIWRAQFTSRKSSTINLS